MEIRLEVSTPSSSSHVCSTAFRLLPVPEPADPMPAALPIGANLDPVQKGHNAEGSLVAPLQGAGFVGGPLPRVSLGSYGASLTLGCIRLPFQGSKWTDSLEKIKILAGNLRFYAISSNFSALSGFFFQQTKTCKQLMRRRISS